jgi:hypothetical protein
MKACKDRCQQQAATGTVISKLFYFLIPEKISFHVLVQKNKKNYNNIKFSNHLPSLQADGDDIKVEQSRAEHQRKRSGLR